MEKPRLTRSEFIVGGLIVLGAAGFGLYKLDEYSYAANFSQIAEEATRTVVPGETLELTNRDIGRENNYVPWTGDVGLTVQRVSLYGSYTEAKDVEDELGNPNNSFSDETVPFLVVELEVRNVDAEWGNFSWSGTDDSVLPGTIRLHSTDFVLCGKGFSLGIATAVIGGKDLSDYYGDTSFTLSQGDSATVLLGFSLEEGKEKNLDGAYIYLVSSYDRLDLGSPTLGGETDESVSS